MRPRALILHAYGSNRDLEAAYAFELAGAEPEIVPLNELRSGTLRWADYQLLCLPGGFAYADALGAGKLLALDLNVYFADQVTAFVDAGKPVIGMCNGFQALVKSGILYGAAVGVLMGLVLGYVVIVALRDQGLTTYSIPVSSVVWIMVLAFIAGVIAAVIPAWRATRLGILSAIAADG